MHNPLFFVKGWGRVGLSLTLLLALGADAYGKADASATAVQVVEEFQEQLLATMREGKTLGYEGRYRKLEPVVLKSHDLKMVARIVIGKYWSDLSEEQKKQFENTFTRLSVATYAYNFKEFSGEGFTFQSEEERGEGNKIIHTVFTDSEGKPVRFDYLMKQKGDRWMIVNIIANGVSDLALKRSEYASIMQQEGFDGLLKKIRSKISDYSNKDS